MFERDAANTCRKLSQQYPVLTIIGPRQSGKTTLARELFSDYSYINLEDPEIREIAVRDPRALLEKYPNRLLIDEVQRVPELLSYIQVNVDEYQHDGMYILTGSHQLQLHQAITQSLAGRTAIIELLPLTLSELNQAGFEFSTNKQMLYGSFPRIFNKNLNPTQVYRDYVKTYLERDVRQLINLKDTILFQRFMKLIASRTGTILNVSNISNDIGVSHNTITNWLSILQASFLVYLLPPYFENFGKQQTKSPKLYFTDVGLASYLMGIETEQQMDRDPLRGQLFETMVVMDLVKTRFNEARESNLYFYRDNKQHEIDLIYKNGSELTPIEIKSACTLDYKFFKGLDYVRDLIGARASKPYLIYAGKQQISLSNAEVIHYSEAYKIV